MQGSFDGQSLDWVPPALSRAQRFERVTPQNFPGWMGLQAVVQWPNVTKGMVQSASLVQSFGLVSQVACAHVPLPSVHDVPSPGQSPTYGAQPCVPSGMLQATS